jgi:glutamyl-tRNA reductase
MNNPDYIKELFNVLKNETRLQIVHAIVDEELGALVQAVKGDSVRETVSTLLSQVEGSRQRELSEALDMMGKLDERQKKIVSDLTRTLLKRTFLPVIENLRLAAQNNETEVVEVAAKLLELHSDSVGG